MTEEKSTPKKTTAPPGKAEADTFQVNLLAGVDGIREDMTESQITAALCTRTAMSASTLKAYSRNGDGLTVTDLLNEMRKAGDEVSGGSTERLERMLVSQALVLDAIFNNLAQRSHLAEYMKNLETYLRLALKAQAQARATVEALALLKNPMPYIRQANIAGGHQQVNNAYAGASRHTDTVADPGREGGFGTRCAGAQARGEDSKIVPSKLMGNEHGERLDFGAQKPAGNADSDLEAVGAIHRPHLA